MVWCAHFSHSKSTRTSCAIGGGLPAAAAVPMPDRNHVVIREEKEEVSGVQWFSISWLKPWTTGACSILNSWVNPSQGTAYLVMVQRCESQVLTFLHTCETVVTCRWRSFRVSSNRSCSEASSCRPPLRLRPILIPTLAPRTVAAGGKEEPLSAQP